MKISRKLRFLFSLTSLMICLCMSTVVVSADTYDDVVPISEVETTTSAEDAKTYVGGKITLGEVKNLTEQMVSAISQFSTCTPEELEYVGDAMAYQTDLYSNFAAIVGDEACGAFVSYDNLKVEEVENDSIDVSAVLHFIEKDYTITLHVTCFDTIGAQVISTEFGLADAGNETIGEKMSSAAINTLVGMGVVFAVLIFISLLISCFAFIPRITNAIQNRNNKKQDIQVQDALDATENIVENVEDNTELIAVIAAAIAASEQTSTDSFVVRSIRRR